jgi:hypothetical protein
MPGWDAPTTTGPALRGDHTVIRSATRALVSNWI